jgi:hypothetical protein
MHEVDRETDARGRTVAPLFIHAANMQ